MQSCQQPVHHIRTLSIWESCQPEPHVHSTWQSCQPVPHVHSLPGSPVSLNPVDGGVRDRVLKQGKNHIMQGGY